MIRAFSKSLYPLVRLLDCLAPLGDLLARIWVAKIFFDAGILKLQAWQSTLMLFQHEYAVPFLSPTFAAVIGTGAELLLPILLLLGLGGRLSILVFFIYNAVAVFSYPHLWTPEGAGGLAQHISWGLLLAMLMFHGPGKWSVDYLIRCRYQRKREQDDAAQLKRVDALSRAKK